MGQLPGALSQQTSRGWTCSEDSTVPAGSPGSRAVRTKNKQPRPSCHCGSSIDTHLTSLSRNSEEIPTTTPFSWSEAARGSECSLFGRSGVGLQSVLPLGYQVFVNPESIQKESGGICEILLNLEATNWRFMNMDYANADLLMSTKHVSQQPG